MARYIDANALIETIKIHAKNVKCENEFANEIYALAHEHIIELVEKQTIDFDVDAVVAELKKESYQEWCDSPKIVELKDAIDIVRNAGKEVRNDKRGIL